MEFLLAVKRQKRQLNGSARQRLKEHACAALEEQDGCCIYCSEPLTEETLTVEHIVSIADGGSDRRDNIAAACFPCNNLKGDMPVCDFIQFVQHPNMAPRNTVEFLMAHFRWRLWRRVERARSIILKTVRMA